MRVVGNETTWSRLESKKKNSKKQNSENFEFWIFILGSSLPQDSLHVPLFRTLKSYFL